MSERLFQSDPEIRNVTFVHIRHRVLKPNRQMAQQTRRSKVIAGRKAAATKRAKALLKRLDR